jgi:hypothetical protein
MIYEFALEPELVARWHDRREYFPFKETFGMKTGRFISAYPKKWKKMVYDAFMNSPDGQNQNAVSRLTALLNDLGEKSVKRKSSFPEMMDWLQRAEAEHGERPFRAILAAGNPRNRDFVIRAEDLMDTGHPLWDIPDDPVVPRKPGDLARAVSPLLQKCRWAVIVDPNFDPGKSRFQDTLKRFLLECVGNGGNCETPQIELHTGIDRCFKSYETGKNRNLDDEQCEKQKLTNNCRKYLPPLIPENMILKIKIWKRKPNGQRLHNRYILTDLASVLFGTGIDHAGSAEVEETDDVRLLSETQHIQRISEYRGVPSAFDLVGDFDLKGEMRSIN